MNTHRPRGRPYGIPSTYWKGERVRITVRLPVRLYNLLVLESELSGTSVNDLIVDSIMMKKPLEYPQSRLNDTGGRFGDPPPDFPMGKTKE